MTEETVDMNDFYFWLDPDTGELEALLEDEFFNRMKKIQEAQRRWEEVDAQEPA